MSDWLESWTGLAWLDPWFLLLSLLLPAAILVARWRGAPSVLFGPATLVQPRVDGGAAAMPSSWRVRLLPLPRVVRIIGLLLLVIAIARPVHRLQLPLEKQGIDILLCIDVSSSMTANDLDRRRTRLDVAKTAAAQFIAGRPDDRIGLIGFARYPDLLCPLTLDHSALGLFLNAVELVEPDGEEDRTGIGTAVARAAQVLRNSLAPSKVVILLTDGEENVATADTPDEIGPLRAARLCEELGVRVYTIAAGIGKRTRAGTWRPLDTKQVQELAERTGGTFYEARDASAVGRVYATINNLEKVAFAEPRYELIERFLPFLIAAGAALLVSRLLESTVFEVLP